LEPLTPIDATSFGLRRLELVDFAIFNGAVIALDNKLGLFSFNYWANKVVNLTHFNLGIIGWGLTMAYAGIYDVLLIAETT